MNEDNIWYASYGSNLLEKRFHCYIQGGQPECSKTIYKGCSDKTLPKEREEIYIPTEIYFAKHSTSWNGGVAFIQTEFNALFQTLGRMYLINKGQFIDVIKQEIKYTGDLFLNFENIIHQKSYVFKQDSWYGNILYLGSKNNFPIFTFTQPSFNAEEINKPSPEYLRQIIKGIRETFCFDTQSIATYLMNKKGIHDNYTLEELTNLINEAIK